MTIKSTIITVTAAAMIAGSAFSLASAGTRELGDAPLQDGFINSDGSKVAQHGFGYSTNQSPVSKLSGNMDINQPTNSADR